MLPSVSSFMMVLSYSSAGDLRRDLVEIGDQLDRRVAVGAHERDRAVERVERLLHQLRLLRGEFVEHDPAAGEVRRHFRGIVEQGARLARFRDLEAQRRIDHGGIDIAGEQVRHQAAAADRHAGEIDLAVLDGPQRQQVGAGAGRRDRDLLAVEVLDVERRLRPAPSAASRNCPSRRWRRSSTSRPSCGRRRPARADRG